MVETCKYKPSLPSSDFVCFLNSGKSINLNADVSNPSLVLKELSEKWTNMSAEEKRPFAEMSKRTQQDFNFKMPIWRYCNMLEEENKHK